MMAKGPGTFSVFRVVTVESPRRPGRSHRGTSLDETHDPQSFALLGSLCLSKARMLLSFNRRLFSPSTFRHDNAGTGTDFCRADILGCGLLYVNSSDF